MLGGMGNQRAGLWKIAKLAGMVGGFKTFSTNATTAAGKAKTFGADLRSGMKMGAMGRDMRSVSGTTGKFGVALGNAGGD